MYTHTQSFYVFAYVRMQVYGVQVKGWTSKDNLGKFIVSSVVFGDQNRSIRFTWQALYLLIHLAGLYLFFNIQLVCNFY